MSMKSPPLFTLNCSRIGLQGGLKTFTDAVMRAVLDNGYNCDAVVPDGYVVPDGIQPIFAPASLAGAATVSRLRPIKWLAYSRFKFPVPRDRKVLCTTHHVLPGRARQIVSILDLRPYFFPDNAVQNFYFRHMLPRSLHLCDGILTISKTSQQMIAEIYKIPLERIAVIPIALCKPEPLNPAQVEEVKIPYLLAVGASWPHKNIEALLNQQHLWSKDYALKVVLGQGQYRTLLEQLTASLGIADRVEFLSNIPAERLEQLFAGCSALVYPSKMEGFGLPPLEAMLRKRPVIVADIPVFRELYGSHAIFVETDDESSWQKAFSNISGFTSVELEAACVHAGTFNRERMAKDLGAAIHRFWKL